MPAQNILAPVSGHLEDLTQVSDPLFAGEGLGRTIPIKPSSSTVVAPISGQVTVTYNTGHAYGIVSDDGVEVLIHIGVDTVNLKGKGFTPKVTKGEHVDAGAPLAEVDLKVIEDHQLDDTIFLIFTNSNTPVSYTHLTLPTNREV